MIQLSELEEAYQLVFKAQRNYSVILSTAINIAIDKVEFMLLYNPKPIQADLTKEKEEYHRYWDEVIAHLKSLRELL